MFLRWQFCVLYSNVLSRGLITSWDQNLSPLNSFVVVSSLCIEVFCKSLGIPLNFFNIYGPYDDMQSFRDMLLWYQWIKCENLIFGSYLNLTINRREVWGPSAWQGKLGNYFRNHFEMVVESTLSLVNLVK